MTPDEKMAGLARELAHTLHTYARERRDDDKKRIAQLHTDLCAAYRAEQEQAAAAEDAAQASPDGGANA
jgi:hypothetical protein